MKQLFYRQLPAENVVVPLLGALASNLDFLADCADAAQLLLFFLPA